MGKVPSYRDKKVLVNRKEMADNWSDCVCMAAATARDTPIRSNSEMREMRLRDVNLFEAIEPRSKSLGPVSKGTG